MKAIWKYNLAIQDNQILTMPHDAQILSVANQNGNLCLWAMVDPEANPVKRCIEIIGTGNPINTDIGTDREFIGTVVINPFVWHVFERWLY